MKKIIYYSMLLFCSLISSTVFAQDNFLDLDGVDDGVTLGNDASVQLSTGTIEAWINTSNAGSSYRGIVVKQGAFGMFLFNNEFVVYDWTINSSINSGSSPNDGISHHVAFVFDDGVSNGSSIYIDGAPVGTPFTYNISDQLVSGLVIGAGYPNVDQQNFDGLIDEVRIWNDVRTPTEILANYNVELTGGEANLVSYYNFNLGNCGVDNSSLPVPQITDLAGSNDGTLQNFDLDLTEDGDGCTSNIVCATCPLFPDNGLIPPGGGAVPTLGQWGLIILTLLLLSFGTVAIRSRQMVLAGTNTSSLTFRQLPFDKGLFIKILLPFSVLILAIFSIAISLFGYELTNADIPGTLMAVPLLAYLLHLLGDESIEK